MLLSLTGAPDDRLVDAALEMVPTVPPAKKRRQNTKKKTHGKRLRQQTTAGSGGSHASHACTSEFGVLVSFLTPSAASDRARWRRGRAGRLHQAEAPPACWRRPRHRALPPRRRRGRRPAGGPRPSYSETGSESRAPSLVVPRCAASCLNLRAAYVLVTDTKPVSV